jgi:hypothetical protein
MISIELLSNKTVLNLVNGPSIILTLNLSPSVLPFECQTMMG